MTANVLSRIFTIEIGDAPTLAFEAQNLREAQELCHEQWLKDERPRCPKCTNRMSLARDDDPRKSHPALVHAHVGLLQPIFKRFLLGIDLCGKRCSDSFVEHPQLFDRH